VFKPGCPCADRPPLRCLLENAVLVGVFELDQRKRVGLAVPARCIAGVVPEEREFGRHAVGRLDIAREIAERSAEVLP